MLKGHQPETLTHQALVEQTARHDLDLIRALQRGVACEAFQDRADEQHQQVGGGAGFSSRDALRLYAAATDAVHFIGHAHMLNSEFLTGSGAATASAFL